MTAPLSTYWFAFSSDDFDAGRHDAHARAQDAYDVPRPDALSLVDAAIVERIHAADAAAFDGLVSTYFPVLVRFATGLSGSHDAAEDAVQGVLARVWQGHATWRPTGGIRPYLFRAVRNQIINDVARVTTARRFREAEVAASDVPAQMPAAEEQLERDERVVALHAALRALSERRRTALRLRFEEQLSYGEIAAVLNLSEKAARELVVRAVGTLRAQLRHLA